MDFQFMKLSVAIIILINVAIALGFKIGQSVGHEDVASGKVECVLVTHSDKTTKWDCKKIEKEIK
jgi:hypothetical protein